MHLYATPEIFYFGGPDVTLRPPTAQATTRVNANNPDLGSINPFPVREIRFARLEPGPGGVPVEQGWNILMARADGSPFPTGVYTALRSHPGGAPPFSDCFRLNGDGWGGDYDSASLNVRDVSYGSGGTLERLAIDFVITEGPFSHNLYGELRYNSLVPLGPSRLTNVSTRLRAGTGAEVSIGGFVVEGTELKKLTIRALGPTLESRGVSRVARLIELTLHDAQGAVIAKLTPGVGLQRIQTSYDVWMSDGYADGIIGFLQSGEPDMGANLPPGAYTVIARSIDPPEGGVVLIEVYDIAAGSPARPVNLSTRGAVGTGDQVMIGGFVVAGPSPHRFIVRAIGPSLAPLGVPGALADPTLELYDSTGTSLAQNDNWQDTQAAEVTASGFVPANAAESAIVVTLQPGAYTAIVRGKNGTTGIGLVEVFDLGPP